MAIPSWHFYLKHTLFNAVALAERSYGINLSQSLHDSKPNVLYVCVHATNVTLRSQPAIRHLNDYWHKIKDGYIKRKGKTHYGSLQPLPRACRVQIISNLQDTEQTASRWVWCFHFIPLICYRYTTYCVVAIMHSQLKQYWIHITAKRRRRSCFNKMCPDVLMKYEVLQGRPGL